MDDETNESMTVIVVADFDSVEMWDAFNEGIFNSESDGLEAFMADAGSSLIDDSGDYDETELDDAIELLLESQVVLMIEAPEEHKSLYYSPAVVHYCEIDGTGYVFSFDENSGMVTWSLCPDVELWLYQAVENMERFSCEFS
jgi:DNA-binding LacI/PurR family transcriptional regulator